MKKNEKARFEGFKDFLPFGRKRNKSKQKDDEVNRGSAQQALLEIMTTAHERSNVQNRENAKQITTCNKEQEQKKEQKDFLLLGK